MEEWMSKGRLKDTEPLPRPEGVPATDASFVVYDAEMNPRWAHVEGGSVVVEGTSDAS